MSDLQMVKDKYPKLTQMEKDLQIILVALGVIFQQEQKTKN